MIALLVSVPLNLFHDFSLEIAFGIEMRLSFHP